MTDTKQTGILRSRWLWFGILLGAYFLSGLWMGRMIITSPLITLGLAPFGIIYEIEKCFGSIRWLSGDILLSGLHLFFWPFFAFFLWRLPYLKKTTFMYAAIVIVLVIVTTLHGCAHIRTKSII